MKYHAVIIIVDDNNNEITSFIKHEEKQFDLPKTNTIVHEFSFDRLLIPESKEMCQFIEEVKRGAK